MERKDEDRQSSVSAKFSTPDFSYYSISSSASSNRRTMDENRGIQMSEYVSCVMTTLKWRSMVLKKRNHQDAIKCYQTLTDNDVKLLVQNTDFKEDEIREWFREFLQDCPDGILTKDIVSDMLSSILPHDNVRVVTDLIFSTFDKDNNDFIDFNEFLIATHCTATSSPEDKLRWVFQLYDKVVFKFCILFMYDFKDGSKSIQLSEMMEVFGTLYLNEGVTEELAIDRAQKIFSFLDVNNDGDISEEEFVRGCLQDEELVRALVNDTSPSSLLVIEDSPPAEMR